MARPELKRAVFALVASIVVIDTLFIAAFYLAHVELWPNQRRGMFVGVWMVITLIAVVLGMGRVRRVRLGLRRRV